MARLSEEEINEVRAHADIVDVISRYVPLNKRGKNYWCPCPFHDDHNPSLAVTPDKQIFKCFVCGAGGNVFTFVSKYEQISFVEAVYKVADYSGIHMEHELVSTHAPVDPRKDALYKTIQDMITFTHYQLHTPDAAHVKEYLMKRGIKEEVMDAFDLGYNPPDDAVYKFLHAKKHSDQDIVEANVARTTSMGMKDVFANRITIPIHDVHGNPVGFSARRIIDNEEAKYINTSQTLVYVKGNLIFNYHRAKPAAKKHGKVFLVEGAMDVIAFAKADIYHAVATLGTACTKEQLNLLKTLSVPLVLCYDGDKAGRDATYKFGKLAREAGLRFEIVENKRGLDPDEIVELHGKEELIRMSEKTISWVEYLFDYLHELYNLDNYSQKKEFAQQLADEIRYLDNDYEQQNYYLRLRELTGFDMSMDKSAQKQQIKEQKKNSYQKRQFLTYPKDGALHAQQVILSQMLNGVQASNCYRDKLGFLKDDAYDKLAIYIIDYYRTHNVVEVADLLNIIKEENIRALLLDISNWELARSEVEMDILEDAINKMRVCMINEKIARLHEQIKQCADPMEKARLGDEKNRLIREKGGILNEENK